MKPKSLFLQHDFMEEIPSNIYESLLFEYLTIVTREYWYSDQQVTIKKLKDHKTISCYLHLHLAELFLLP